MRLVRSNLLPVVAVASAAGIACRPGTGTRPIVAERSASASSSASASPSAVASSASSSIPSCTEPSHRDFTPSSTQPTTTDALHEFTGHWRVTGSPLRLHAYRDGIALIFTVEEDTPSYRKGEVRFELEMSLNGTGFSVREHERPDPGGKTFSDKGLLECQRWTRVTSDDVYHDYLHAWVIDADTLRVQRLVWDARFEMDGDGRIARCPKLEICNDAWDELRHEK